MKKFNKNSIIITLAILFVFGLTGIVIAATSVSLGTADGFAILAGSTITNTGSSVVTGNIGLSPGTSVTGFPPGTLIGTQYVNNATAATAQSNLTTAYNNAAGQTPVTTTATQLGGTTKTAGIYNSADGTFGITGTLTLDGQDDPNAVFIFKTSSTLITAGSSVVNLINEAQACNVFWQVGSSATLGADSSFVGNILALTSVTLTTGADVEGRVLARNGAVTLDSNNVTKAVCASPTTLRVVKTVINGNGGAAVSSDFSLSVKKAGVNITGSPANGVVAPGTLYTVAAGTYVVSEVTDPSYTQSFTGDCNAGGSVTLSAGENKTCTIVNTEIVPDSATLHVIKTVVNSSGEGTAVSSDFLMHVKKNGVDVSSPTAGVISPGTSFSLAAGTYVVSEVANSSYTQIFSGSCDAGGSITLAAGEDKTCTITNTDIPLPPAPATYGGSYFAPLPLINVTKIPYPLALPSGPGLVNYTYTLTNLGTVAMRGIWAKDNKCTPVTYVSGDTNKDSLLDETETWIYRCAKTVSKTETNTVTVHGNANGWEGYDTANATVVVGGTLPPPLIHLVKKPSTFFLPVGGGAVTYMYTVTNPGTAPLSNVIITDNKCTGLPGRVIGHPGDLNKNNLLESNEAWSFTCKTNLTQTTTNLASAMGDANGLTAIDFSQATVAVAVPGLPNTGFHSENGNINWYVLLGVLILTSISFVVVLRKHTS